jgi:hypothetical protein
VTLSVIAPQSQTQTEPADQSDDGGEHKRRQQSTQVVPQLILTAVALQVEHISVQRMQHR